MQFACSPSSKALREIVEQTHALDAEMGSRWLALLDGSMLKPATLASLERKFGVNAFDVLSGTRLDAFGRQGPLIFPVSPETHTVLDDLIRMCSAIPALSFVAPRQGVDLVKEALCWLSLASTTDGTELHCRFADTRVMPNLLDALTLQQRENLSAAIKCWYWPDRQGARLEKYEFPVPAQGDDASSPYHQPFELDNKQYAQTLRAAEADMVFQMLIERMPDVKPQQPGGEVHARIERMLVAAHTHGLEDLPDLFQYIVLGLSTQDAFDRHPALQSLWPAFNPKKQRFSDWVEQWPSQVWQALGGQEQTTA